MGPWRTLEQIEFETLKWTEWFNNRRLLRPNGHRPTAELVAEYYAAIDESAMAA